MVKKILISIGVLLTITCLCLTYSAIGCLVIGSRQPKIISTDGHTTYSWGFYTVGIVFLCIALFAYLILALYIIISVKKYKKYMKKKLNNNNIVI